MLASAAHVCCCWVRQPPPCLSASQPCLLPRQCCLRQQLVPGVLPVLPTIVLPHSHLFVNHPISSGTITASLPADQEQGERGPLPRQEAGVHSSPGAAGVRGDLSGRVLCCLPAACRLPACLAGLMLRVACMAWCAWLCILCPARFSHRSSLLPCPLRLPFPDDRWRT